MSGAEIQSTPLWRTSLVELRKMVDTRSGKWMLIAIALSGALIAAGGVLWGKENFRVWGAYLNAMSIPLVLLMPVLGIMAATQEWSVRTGLSTFTLEPRRQRVIIGKVVAAVTLTLVVIGVTIVASAAANALGGGMWTLVPAKAEGSSATVIMGFALVMIVMMLQGLAFGLAFLNTTIAIVLSLLLPNLWTVATQVVTPLREVAKWLDLKQTASPVLSGGASGTEWAQLLTSSVLWIGIPLGIGVWRVLTSEVK